MMYLKSALHHLRFNHFLCRFYLGHETCIRVILFGSMHLLSHWIKHDNSDEELDKRSMAASSLCRFRTFTAHFSLSFSVSSSRLMFPSHEKWILHTKRFMLCIMHKVLNLDAHGSLVVFLWLYQTTVPSNVARRRGEFICQRSKINCVCMCVIECIFPND